MTDPVKGSTAPAQKVAAEQTAPTPKIDSADRIELKNIDGILAGLLSGDNSVVKIEAQGLHASISDILAGKIDLKSEDVHRLTDVYEQRANSLFKTASLGIQFSHQEQAEGQGGAPQGSTSSGSSGNVIVDTIEGVGKLVKGVFNIGKTIFDDITGLFGKKS